MSTEVQPTYDMANFNSDCFSGDFIVQCITTIKNWSNMNNNKTAPAHQNGEHTTDFVQKLDSDYKKSLKKESRTFTFDSKISPEKASDQIFKEMGIDV